MTPRRRCSQAFPLAGFVLSFLAGAVVVLATVSAIALIGDWLAGAAPFTFPRQR